MSTQAASTSAYMTNGGWGPVRFRSLEDGMSSCDDAVCEPIATVPPASIPVGGKDEVVKDQLREVTRA